MSRAPSDYWITCLDGAHAVRSARGFEAEGIQSYGDALAVISDLEAADQIEAEQAAAALADYHADLMREAA
ncbi:hypothetical protein [Methylobacterium sp. ARG-1]|uniref:hypothetical protein n=1 Tax=Methylobacterium sp. ARG-1 TaxID=1692501 RepID=UPI000682E364|nr:hypothetical protein [Methylobacterium sp. ARG-1]KNY20386.1 hypothetical protein AKJ13_22415 [Methylobacterium sp. ARG-1]